MTLPRFLLAQDVAESLNVSRVRTLLDWHRDGKFPAPYRIGSRWMFAEDDVERWLRESKLDANQQELRLDFIRSQALNGRRARRPRGRSAAKPKPAPAQHEESAARAHSDSGRSASGSSDASS